jgi:heterodisulfide reductase subunit B
MDGASLSAHSMDRRNQTTVIFACPNCGLAHEVTQEHVPAKMSGDLIAPTAEPQSILGMAFLIIPTGRRSKLSP